jgi:hypothetical protein
MLYRGMDRTQLNTAYNNTAAVPQRDAIVAGWAARSARVRRERLGHLDLAYGDSPRETAIDGILPPRHRGVACRSQTACLAGASEPGQSGGEGSG